MSTTLRTWTVEELIAWEECEGEISPPFSADERALAAAVAAAYYFWAELTELPARAPCDTAEWGAMWLGIHRVKKRRNGECMHDLIDLFKHDEKGVTTADSLE